MKILAIDTSGSEGSIALSEDRSVVAESVLPAAGRRHAQTLVPEVDRLLKAQQLRSDDIDAVAVSVGPGSFTGLRVGVVFAKTFAWANEAALLAVDTLQAVAQQLTAHDGPVTVISDAQRQEVFVSDYEWDAADQCRVAAGEIRIQPIAEFVEHCGAADSRKPRRVVTGPGLDTFASRFPDHGVLADAALWRPRAAAVAVIGSAMLGRGQLSDVYSLEPVYIRRSYAEENAARS